MITITRKIFLLDSTQCDDDGYTIDRYIVRCLLLILLQLTNESHDGIECDSFIIIIIIMNIGFNLCMVLFWIRYKLISDCVWQYQAIISIVASLYLYSSFMFYNHIPPSFVVCVISRSNRPISNIVTQSQAHKQRQNHRRHGSTDINKWPLLLVLCVVCGLW